ncbi:MAG: hypothetical protein GY771_14130 [bacterium]|nr:hypothetical protein [bacterium]
MTALTANYDAERKDGLLISYPVEAATTVYKNALVCANDDGYLLPGDDASGYIFLGIAYEKGDNSDGGDADMDVRTWKGGTYVLATNFTAAQEDVGSEVYIIDDNTVGLTSTNTVKCGVIVEVISSSEVRIRIDNYVN